MTTAKESYERLIKQEGGMQENMRMYGCMGSILKTGG